LTLSARDTEGNVSEQSIPINVLAAGDKPDLQVVSPRTTTGEVYANEPARVSVSVLLAGDSQEIKVILLDQRTNQPLGTKTFSAIGNQVQDILFDILYPNAGKVPLSATAELVDPSVHDQDLTNNQAEFELEVFSRPAATVSDWSLF
ncbi:MAG TPA: hypothetical protein PK360_15755, partial [bacterium]|nr:hypothetical protein [bacterium]